MNKKKAIIFIVTGLIFCIIVSLMCIDYQNESNSTVATVRLNIETYLAGKDQPTHPSVISFVSPWNGYKYWMVYTPYPEGNGEEENPSIAVSNDMYEWVTPYGMVNPIAYNEETGCNELKDGHILYRNDLDRIEVWYLGRVSKNLGGDGTSLTLMRKYSYDGISWSQYEIMDTVEYLSPSIIWNGQKYQMWSIGFNTYDTEGTFVYQESVNGKDWTTPMQCSIDNKNHELELWHGAVVYDGEKKEYIFTYIQTSGNSQAIEACVSKDGIHFAKSYPIVKNNNDTLWDRFYRPCILLTDNEYYVFYGVITEENQWYISFSSGQSLAKLHGLKDNDVSKMTSLNSQVQDTKGIMYVIKKVYHSIQQYLKIETMFLIVLFIILDLIIYKKKRSNHRLVISVICVFLCLVYTVVRIQPVQALAIVGVIGASLIEGVSIACIGSVFMNNICRNKL